MSIDRSSRTWLLVTIALVLAVAGTGATQEPQLAPASRVEQPAPPIDPLVTAQWLSVHLDDPDLVVLDCTVAVERNEDGTMDVVSGRSRYDSGHIPTAGFADLTADLTDPDSRLRFAVPEPAQFAAAMAALGVDDRSRVVLYDTMGSSWAARVWWMLKWIGFDRAAILDGGLEAWTAGNRPLSTEPAERPAGTLTVALRPNLIADRDEVLAAVDDPSVHIVDALPEPHYRGQVAMYARPGHIPSAVNIPVTDLTDESGGYHQLDELASMYTTDPDSRHIIYCGGGIAASNEAFVMTRLGYTDVAVYAASLQEWAADPNLPMETAPAQ
jgi:thiosulfate/3-mercaptopyruvate sulfurtransferase